MDAILTDLAGVVLANHSDLQATFKFTAFFCRMIRENFHVVIDSLYIPFGSVNFFLCYFACVKEKI
jgi:hypothetical protein